MLPFTDCIPLFNQLVRVTHWQSFVKKDIAFSERSTYKEFCVRVKLNFPEEIDGDGRNPPDFRIYTLPAGYKDVGQRELVDDDMKFDKLRDNLMDAFASHRLIYVWNYDDKVSPAKLPPNVAQAKSDTGSVVSRTSVVSRDSNSAKYCKSRDGNSCLCCGFFGRDGFGMEACHIYEVGAHNSIKEEERLDKLKHLQLFGIHDLVNLITLCKDCHNKFDTHKLGIHPTEQTWIVTNSLREGEAVAQSNIRFIDIHAMKVPFAATRFIPPTEVLVERISYFLRKNPGDHYCHICSYVCTNNSEFAGHIKGCGATALPKSFSGLGIN